MVQPSEFPIVVEVNPPASDVLTWAMDNATTIRERLNADPALLLRGLSITSGEMFQTFVHAVAGDPIEYAEPSSPRHKVVGNVYTSTDYPPQYPIFLHNENSYARAWPMRLLFYCHAPAESGGETPIASNRRITESIELSVRRQFADRGVMYVRNFMPGVGLPWSTVFGTSDRSEVEQFCREAGMQFEWLPSDGLRVRYVRPAFRRHPQTQELLWFNHVTFYHVNTLEPEIREALTAFYTPDELPNNTYYGDGGAIEPDVIEHLRSAYHANTVRFQWRTGDVMLLDNMLVSHGRAPYKGHRQIMVAMTDLLQGDP